MVFINSLDIQTRPLTTRKALANTASSSEATAESHRTQTAKPVTIILQIQESARVSTAKGAAYYEITLAPILLIDVSTKNTNEDINNRLSDTDQTLAKDLLSIKSNTAFAVGELVSASGKIIRSPNEKTLLVLQKQLQALSKQAQAPLLPAQPSDQSSAKLPLNTLSDLLTPLLDFVKDRSESKAASGSDKSSVQAAFQKLWPHLSLLHRQPPTAQLVSPHFLNTKPPPWLSQLPQMSERALAHQNLNLLDEALKSARVQLGPEAPLITKPLLTSLAAWSQLQRKWLEAPQTLQYKAADLISKAQQTLMLGPTQRSQLSAVHQQLLRVWPEYLALESELKRITTAPLDQYTRLGAPSTTQKTAKIVVQQLLANEDQISEKLNALMLRLGLAQQEEMQSNNQKHESQPNEIKTTHSLIPFGPVTELRSWIEISTFREHREKNQKTLSQQIELKFLSEAFGAIQVKLRFPQGFDVMQCEASFWLDSQASLKLFQKYETSLHNNLKKAGLVIQKLHWSENITTAKWQGMYQIDAYV